MSSSYDICIQCLGNLNYLSSFLLKDLINFTVGPCWLFFIFFLAVLGLHCLRASSLVVVCGFLVVVSRFLYLQNMGSRARGLRSCSSWASLPCLNVGS